MRRHRVILLCMLCAVLAGTATETSACCVSLSWTAPGDDGMLGQATLYEIRYSKAPITESNWILAPVAGWAPIPELAGTPQTAVVSNLQVGQRYYFAIRTRDEMGNWSAISNVVSAIVESDICTGVTGNVNCDPEDKVNLTDLTAILDFLFITYRPLNCPLEANVNGDPEGNVNLVDVSHLVNFLYNGGQPPAPCQ